MNQILYRRLNAKPFDKGLITCVKLDQEADNFAFKRASSNEKTILGPSIELFKE